jgi:hypothetical protein
VSLSSSLNAKSVFCQPSQPDGLLLFLLSKASYSHSECGPFLFIAFSGSDPSLILILLLFAQTIRKKASLAMNECDDTQAVPLVIWLLSKLLWVPVFVSAPLITKNKFGKKQIKLADSV